MKALSHKKAAVSKEYKQTELSLYSSDTTAYYLRLFYSVGKNYYTSFICFVKMFFKFATMSWYSVSGLQ